MTDSGREQERFSLNLQAKISFRHTKDQTQVIETVAANISSGGAFLLTDQNLPVAAKVNIEFYLSVEALKKLKFILSLETLKQLTHNKVWVHTTGVIIRKEKNGVGIIFDKDYQLTAV